MKVESGESMMAILKYLRVIKQEAEQTCLILYYVTPEGRTRINMEFSGW